MVGLRQGWRSVKEIVLTQWIEEIGQCSGGTGVGRERSDGGRKGSIYQLHEKKKRNSLKDPKQHVFT